MVKMKNSGRMKWLLIILGVVALAIAVFFIVRAMTGDGSSFKEYDTEQSSEGVAVKLNTVERLPMASEKCQERILLIGKEEDFYCLIANVTITNNTDRKYDYSYRQFGYIDPRTNKLRPTAITRITFPGIDITKDMPPRESHTQDVFYVIQNVVSPSDIKMIYKVDPKAEDGETEIALPL
jgi:hypothetical protein